MASAPMEVAALGRPLFPGMLYDCRKDSFIPGVTLWDKNSLSEDLDSRPQLQTDLKLSSSDSLSSKSSLMDISASLKTSFLGGLVEVGGSAKYLHDTKSSNQQSRVTMYYSETSRFEQLTMTQLDKVTYPQVFDQQTATHVVTAVLYGARAFMVFDRTFSENENKENIEGELNVMVKKIAAFSIEGKGAVQMTANEKEVAENISCTFHGDFHLKQNPTTYMEALDLYKKLPTLMKDSAVPVKVWLYPLHLLDNKAAQLEREISSGLVSNTQDIIEGLEEAERTYNDLSRNTLVNVFRDIKERLNSFQESFNIYRSVLRKELSMVLPVIRGGGMEEKSLAEMLKIHYDSPFVASKINQWLDDVKSELHLLSSYIKMLEGIKIQDSDSLKAILLNPDVDSVVCLTFTSLKFEDPYLECLTEFLKIERFKNLDEETNMVPVPAVKKWFSDLDVIINMRNNLLQFRSFSEANKDQKRICFIISAISDPSKKGSSIYLYEKGKLTNTQFQPNSKPIQPIIKILPDETVSIKMQKPPNGGTVQYRVEYKQIENYFGADQQWHVINTDNEELILTGLKSGKMYWIRYRIVSTVGVSENSETVSFSPSSVRPQLVGGTGGSEFSFVTSAISTFKKITVTYGQDGNTYPMKSIQILFSNGHVMVTGKSIGDHKKELLFDDNDKIIAATLWSDKNINRLSGMEFVVVNAGVRKTLSVMCTNQGYPVRLDVKSGKCYGIIAKHGSDIDSLGFFFI
ncbi:cytolytic toxin-alpha [Puntigrus tetrazona]|uniref:cytolytic toxin-alpha n=1 Tax=Puntigrus tetrazona TaxID=1606681 RepID=UPI001C8A7E46|nr:cytolytic toxin-alpha [Puntigrus tetrazona]